MKRKKESLTVGIPRCLFYYLYPGLWESFFRCLGCRIILSRPTDRKTVSTASRISEPEHCLPVKLLDAHIEDIRDRADLVFVPRILSTLKGHISCPKLSALPDTARLRCRNILTQNIDLRRTKTCDQIQGSGAGNSLY